MFSYIIVLLISFLRFVISWLLRNVLVVWGFRISSQRRGLMVCVFLSTKTWIVSFRVDRFFPRRKIEEFKFLLFVKHYFPSFVVFWSLILCLFEVFLVKKKKIACIVASCKRNTLRFRRILGFFQSKRRRERFSPLNSVSIRSYAQKAKKESCRRRNPLLKFSFPWKIWSYL